MAGSKPRVVIAMITSLLGLMYSLDEADAWGSTGKACDARTPQGGSRAVAKA